VSRKFAPIQEKGNFGQKPGELWDKSGREGAELNIFVNHESNECYESINKMASRQATKPPRFRNSVGNKLPTLLLWKTMLNAE
jgi:hypothetical protein